MSNKQVCRLDADVSTVGDEMTNLFLVSQGSTAEIV